MNSIVFKLHMNGFVGLNCVDSKDWELGVYTPLFNIAVDDWGNVRWRYIYDVSAGFIISP